MNKKGNLRLWRSFCIFLLLTLIFSPVFGVKADSHAISSEPDQPSFRGNIEKSPIGQNKPILSSQAINKLDSFLQNLALDSLSFPDQIKNKTKANQKAVLVNLTGEFSADNIQELKTYFVDGKLVGSLNELVWEKGLEQSQQKLLSGLIMPNNLLKVASFPQVHAIYNTEPVRMVYEPVPADDTQTKPGPKNWELLRENADRLRQELEASSAPTNSMQPSDEPNAIQSTDDWYEMSPMGPVKAEVAWERGFTGQGVKVAVIDDGIDFAHPDLIGTQAIYNSSIYPHLNGWPIVMDPFTLRAYFYDSYFGTTYISGGFPGVTLVDTSATPGLVSCGTGLKCFTFTPQISYNTPGTQHSYTIRSEMSLSGEVHVGTHHDESLRDYVWGERVAVLVTDPNMPGVYDTVYIDLNNNYSFTDEKPLTKANPDIPETYNNMVAYRDENQDGKADLNGGLLYFIADGLHYVPTTDWLFNFLDLNIRPPENGDLIGLHGPWDSGYSHGTQCASNIVASGQIDGYLPKFLDLDPYPGTAVGSVYGAAPDANLIAMNASWGFTGNATYRDAYLLAAIGWDGIDQNGVNFLTQADQEDTDAIQISNNSYGFSAEFNDGWDNTSLIIEDIQRRYAPNLQFLFSTGNGGPGYGTAAPPSPSTGIAVGASTEYGSTGWDSITYTHQINYSDIAAFSNSGPGARAGAGVDVVAGGAYAAGAEELNYYGKAYFDDLDGNLSWSTWGGTSRSSPVAAGVLALIYQSYKQKHGNWPTAATAKSILMASASDINHDVFKQGAGQVNADIGTALANGLYGVYTNGNSESWTPGDYHGFDAPNFANIVSPGSSWQKSFSLINDSSTDIEVSLQSTGLNLIEKQDFTFTITPEMVASESAYGTENRDNFYRAFNFFIPLNGFGDYDRITIPDNTDLMVIRQVYDYDQFDIDHNYAVDNRFFLTVYNWKDINTDGNVWEDVDENQVVNFINDPTNLTGIDQAAQLAWDDPRNELDQWEYGRFGYNRPAGNTHEVSIQDPLNRKLDGIFIGLRHIFTQDASAITTNLKYQVEFYEHLPVDWLTTDVVTTTVPAASSANFTASAIIPSNMPAGSYAAAIEIHNPGNETYSENSILIPVSIHVAAVLTNEIPEAGENNSITLGGAESLLHDQALTYNNGNVRGYFDWGWREESGDWRNFYIDLQSPTSILPYTAHVILQDQWDEPAPYTDIDTIVLGPSNHPSQSWTSGIWPFDTYDSAIHGPYNLETIARSADERAGQSIWRFNTTSNSNQEWLFFPFQEGLHEILQHNVLYQGDVFEKGFTKKLGLMFEDVIDFNIDTYYNQGPIGEVNLFSTIDLSGLQADAFLYKEERESFISEELSFSGAGTLEWTYIFQVENAVSIELSTSSDNIADLDMYLFYNKDGKWEQRASSATPSSSETIYYPDPEDGYWLVGVDNYSGPSGTFNLDMAIINRSPGINASVNSVGAIPANTPVTVQVTYDANLDDGVNYGSLFIGPPEAPHLKEIPITINKLPMKNAWVKKSVDYDLHFPGDDVLYTIDIFNTFPTHPIVWELSDFIPDLTSYVGADLICEGDCGELIYDSLENKLNFWGELPTSASGLFTSFENSGLWPEGWTTVHLGETPNQWMLKNTIPYSGLYHAYIQYDLENFSDEWLFTPEFAVTEEDHLVSFYVYTNTEYPEATLKLHVTDLDGNILATIWDMIENEDWETYEYRQKVLNLADFAGQHIKLAWQYIGINGETVFLDDVSLPGYLPAARIDLQVQVEPDFMLSGGQTITNSVTLQGAAVFPQEEQFLLERQDMVTMLIGIEDLSTSFKSAPTFIKTGEILEYQIHLINSGQGIADVQMTDPIPVGSVLDSYEPTSDPSFFYNETLNQMEWSGLINPEDDKVLIIRVLVTGEEGSTIINDASLVWNSGNSHLLASTTIGDAQPTYLPIIIK